MASGSGKDPDPVYGPLEESNAAAAAAEAVPPPPAPPAEDLHERPGEGGGCLALDAAEEAEAAAAAAADRKGKKVAASSPSSPSSAGSISPPAAPVDSISAGEGSSLALAVDSRREGTVSWKERMVGEIVAVPKETRRIDPKDVLDTMLQKQKAIKDTERPLAEAEEQEKWQMKSPILWRQKKDSLWSKLKCGLTNMVLQRIGRQIPHSNQNFTLPHVDELVVNTFARRLCSSRWIVLATFVITFAYFPVSVDGFRMYDEVGKAAVALQELPNLMDLRNQLAAELAELAAPAVPPPRAALGVNWWLLFTGSVCIAWLFASLNGGQVPMGEQAPDISRPPEVEVNLWTTMVIVVGFALVLMLVGVCAITRHS